MKCAPFMNPVITQVSGTVAVLRPVKAYTRPEENVTGMLPSKDIPARISKASESSPGTGSRRRAETKAWRGIELDGFEGPREDNVA